MEKKEQKFYLCQHCENLVGLIEDSGIPVYCCKNPMERLEGGSTAFEINISTNDGAVSVASLGSNTPDWVYLQTNRGGQRKSIEKENKSVRFLLEKGEKGITVFAYSTVFGLFRHKI